MSKWQTPERRAITVTLTMEQWQADALRAIAKAYGMSLSETIRAPAVAHWMRQAPDAWKTPSGSPGNTPVSPHVSKPLPDTGVGSGHATGATPDGVVEIDFDDLMGSE